jgi:hypothetical protein
MGGCEQALVKKFEQLRRDDFAGVSIVQIIVFKDDRAKDGFRPSLAFLQERERELRERGIALQTIPWQTSDKAIFVKLASAGVRFFGTDYPDTALAAYREVVNPGNCFIPE